MGSEVFSKPVTEDSVLLCSFLSCFPSLFPFPVSPFNGPSSGPGKGVDFGPSRKGNLGLEPSRQICLDN